jgi:hypothetical protein
MKTHRKSRSTENRNAREEMIARGTPMRERTLPETFVPDRRWRRVARRALAGCNELELRNVGRSRSTVTFRVDPRTRMIIGFDVS